MGTTEAQLEQRRRNVARIAQRTRERTHCRNNHEYTPKNTIQKKDGYRQCRTCKDDSSFAFLRNIRRILHEDRKHRLHGTKTGANYGCKCLRCRLVAQEIRRERKERKG